MAIRAHRLQTLRRIVYIDSHNTSTETLWLLTAATGRATTFHAARHDDGGSCRRRDGRLWSSSK